MIAGDLTLKTDIVSSMIQTLVIYGSGRRSESNSPQPWRRGLGLNSFSLCGQS